MKMTDQVLVSMWKNQNTLTLLKDWKLTVILKNYFFVSTEAKLMHTP